MSEPDGSSTRDSLFRGIVASSVYDIVFLSRTCMVWTQRGPVENILTTLILERISLLKTPDCCPYSVSRSRIQTQPKGTSVQGMSHYMNLRRPLDAVRRN